MDNEVKISELAASDVGRSVTYVDRAGKCDFGVVTSWNDQYVFVRYGSALNGIATHPSDLTWDHPRIP